MYISFKCLICNTTITSPIEDIKRMELEGRHVRCIFGHKEIIKLNQYEGIRDCMSHDTYKKDHGVTKQTGWSR